MDKESSNKKVAILATNGFEESELHIPLETLKKTGMQVDIISLKPGTIRGWKNGNWTEELKVDHAVESVKSSEYDALVLPGGVMNPDKLRVHAGAVRFVNGFLEENKPVAAICHGPWTLIETGKLRGRKMTSWPSLKTDLINAGVTWEDREVINDKGLITSRRPDDLDAFCASLIHEMETGVQP